jgi:hypothetical protein
MQILVMERVFAYSKKLMRTRVKETTTANYLTHWPHGRQRISDRLSLLRFLALLHKICDVSVST